MAVGLRRSLEAPSSPAILAELDQAVLKNLIEEWTRRRNRFRRALWTAAGVAASALIAVASLLWLDGRGARTPEVRHAVIPVASPVPAVAAVPTPRPEPALLATPAPATAPAAAPAPAAPEPGPESLLVHGPRPGDLNGDGRVDGADSMLLLDFVVNGGPEPEPTVADLNGDGRIDIGDALALSQLVESGS